jgi:hypothetical protein
MKQLVLAVVDNIGVVATAGFGFYLCTLLSTTTVVVTP